MHTGIRLLSSVDTPADARQRDPSADTRAVSTVIGAEQPRTTESETVHFEPWPSINAFRHWIMSFRSVISSSSTKQSLSLAWASDIDEATHVGQLRTSVYSQDGMCIDFETLDTKVAAGLMKVMHGDAKKRITMRDEQHQVLHKKDAYRPPTSFPHVPALPDCRPGQLHVGVQRLAGARTER